MSVNPGVQFVNESTERGVSSSNLPGKALPFEQHLLFPRQQGTPG